MNRLTERYISGLIKDSSSLQTDCESVADNNGKYFMFCYGKLDILRLIY